MPPAIREVPQDRLRRSDEVGDRERLVRIDEVEEVMRDPPALGERRLGRPDVHPPVDLARIGREDLDRPVRAAELAGDPDRQAGLAGRRRATDDDEGRSGRGYGQASAPRSEYGPACSIRTSTSRPTRSADPAQMDEGMGPAPAGQVERIRRSASASGVELCVMRPGRHDRLDEDLRRRPDPCPVALEADRLLAGEELVQAAPLGCRGTSSAMCVAGVPGRTE